MQAVFHPYVVTGFLTSIVTAAVGVFVYFKDRHSPIHRSFLLFSISIWQWSFFTALQGIQTDANWGLFWGRFCHIGAMLIPVFFYYFTLKITGTRRQALLTGGFLTAFLLIILFFTTPFFIPTSRTDVGPNYLTKAGPLYGIMIFFFSIYVLLALIRLWNEIRRSRGARRKHLQYFFLASFIGFGIGVFNFFPVYGLTIPPYPYSAACGALYSCVIAYAILRHKLFNIELMVKKGIIFGVLFGTVYLMVSAFTFAIGYLVAGRSVPLLSAVSIAMAMILYEPLKRLLTQLTNNFLFQKKTDYTTLVHHLTDKLAKTRDTQTLAEEIAHFLTEQMALEWAGLYLREDGKPDLHLRSSPENLTLFKLNASDPIVDLVSRRDKPLILSPFDLDSGLSQELKTKLRREKIEAVVPIFLEGKLYGILLLGKKKSDDAFETEDEALLQTLMDEVGMFFLSANLLRQVTRSNLDLGQRMKMAAVTRLAGGVHHEVRNPLHTIDLSMATSLMKISDGRYRKMPVTDIAIDINKQIASVEEEINRIMNSLDRFAQFARPEEDVDIEPLCLKDELEKFLALMQEGQELDQIQVYNTLSKETRVLATEGGLRAIFFNLFNNAYEAMNGKGKLFITAQVSGDFVAIKIRDTGCGIRPEVLPHIFDSYFTTKKGTETVGIGLSIIKHHTEQLGGSIKAASVESGGAEFTVKLRQAFGKEQVYA